MSLRRAWPQLAVPVLLLGLLLLRNAVVDTQLQRLAPTSAAPGDPPGTTARSGSIYLPRSGPYIVGFLASGDARLDLGTVVITGSGLVTRRVVLDAGVVPVRLASPGRVQLVWSPPGRRGDPEYVPVSSLSPRDASRATFGAGVGAARLDGVIALAMLLLVVGWALYLVRRRLAGVPRATWIAIGVVFAGALLVRLYDLNAAGATWDEDVNWAAGRNYVTNVLAGDLGASAWRWNYEHPPVMKYLMGIGAQLADGYGPARAIAAILVALGCALLVPIGARLFRLRVGCFAGGIAALTPALVAHGKIAGHEAPTVLWWALGILAALGFADDLEARLAASRHVVLRRAALLGVILGLAVGSRFINGLLAPLVVGIAWLVTPPRLRRRVAPWLALAVPVVAIVTFVALWPRLWWDPIGRLAASWARLKKPHADEPFLGLITNTPPRTYFIVCLAATTPALVLATALVGPGFTWLRRWHAAPVAMPWRSLAIVGAWLVVPLVVSFSPVRQDGVRYVLPTVMAICMASGLSLSAMVDLAVCLPALARPRAVAVALGVAMAMYLALACARIHPYYLDYFGEQVGGVAGVQQRRWFETAWWGEGLDRAVAYVNAEARPGDRVFRGCILPAHLAWFRGDLWTTMADAERDATWIVAYSPAINRCVIPPGFALAHAVTIDGAILATVYKRP